jgi:branched-chain amino acid transport system permease protein
MEQAEITLGEIWIRGDLIFVFIMSVVSMIVLLWLLYRTSLGVATRAVSSRRPRRGCAASISTASTPAPSSSPACSAALPER